jgi:acetyl esterase/lipase
MKQIPDRRYPEIFRRTAALLAGLCGFAALAQPAAPAVPPAKNLFHIYLLMGQSNMAGRGVLDLAAPANDPRILSLNASNQWVVARDPLHQKDGRIEPGVGPGISFAREMAKADSNIVIGLVPCAVGGTSLKRWVKGGDLYERAVSRAKLAAESGVICGVLWHQGESDSDKNENAESYAARLTKMFQDLRTDLGMPELPVVVGQLGEFLPPEKHPYADTVRTAIKNIPTAVPHAGFADSAGLGDKGDKLHFTTEAQRQLGARYAAAMLALQNAGHTNISATATVVDVWPGEKMPGGGAREAEGDFLRAGETQPRTDAKRITNVSHPTLTVFPAKEKYAPAMIVCPGGGYSYVVVDKEGYEIAAWLNANGITAAVLKYRVPHNRDGALQDVQRALSLARAHAAAWNLDPHRLGAIGFSAGGNLAARASTSFAERTYAAIDAVDQQSCRPDFAVLVYPAYLDDKNGRVATNLNLKAKIPPTLIVHSEDDKTFVPGSKLYSAALAAANVPHEFKLYSTGGHGYGLHCEREAKAWPPAALDWLQRMNLR